MIIIIRLFVTITIMLSRSKIVVFLLARHDTTICYFRQPALCSYSNSSFKISSEKRARPTLLISVDILSLHQGSRNPEDQRKINVNTVYCFNE